VSAYRIISAERASFPVSVMCETLGVSKSGFHAWERRAPSDRELSDAWLTSRIKEIHENARGVYGSRRVQAELRLGQDVIVSRKRIRRLMRQARDLGAGEGQEGAAPRSGCRVSGSLMTSSSVASRLMLQTSCGSPTSPISGPGRGGSTSPQSRTRIFASHRWVGR
jgi:transposase InsO family protein